MSTLKNSFLAFLLFATSISFGQVVLQQVEEKPFIEVTGSADKEIIPDEIYLSISIKERYEGKDKISIEIQEEKLKAKLKELNIDLKNLSLSDANAGYVRVRWQKKDVITQKDYSLKLSTATQVGAVFQELDKLDIKDAYISKVDHSNIENLKKEIRIEAIKDAKNKADYLLEAIGQETGKPLVINETQPIYFNNDQMYIRTASIESYSKVSSGEKMEEIDFQKIKLSSQIYVKFSIK